MTTFMTQEDIEMLEEEMLKKLSVSYSLFYGGYIVEIKDADLEDCICDVVSSNFYSLNSELFKTLPTKILIPMEQRESGCEAKFRYMDIVENFIEYVVSLAKGVVL